VSFREFLENAEAAGHLAQPPTLSAPKLIKVVSKVSEKFAEGGPPPASADLNKLIDRFRQATADQRLEQFSQREWKQICWGMWEGSQPLAEQTPFLDMLLARLWDGPSRSLCKTLITVYLAKFNAALLSIGRVAQALGAVVSTWPWPWEERHQRFLLFDPARGPVELAKHCCQGDAPVAVKLEEAGISGVRRLGGMEVAAFQKGVEALKRRFAGQHAQSRPLMHRLFDWYEEALREGGAAAFQPVRSHLAEALLAPWQDATPDDSLRELITDFLLRHFGDPRIRPEKWVNVDEGATAVLRRWLTRIALEQFFEVVDQVAEAGHWMYRRPFWMSYYRMNVIDDAWVLFGPQARHLAKSVLPEVASFGMLDNPRLANHSIILMRIGGLTIAEVSHTGKCRIWVDGSRRAPRLYRTRYYRNDIEDNPDFEQVHNNSDRFYWQNSIAQFIRVRTGIRPRTADWHPE
jgi:hypothetical protein